MKSFIVTSIAAVLAYGCGGSYPPPTQQMADVQSANRSATELGAQKNPTAQLHLKLSEEQMKKAKAAMEKEDNESAESYLTRAKADAELAIALTREDKAEHAETEAVDKSNVQRSTNMEQGANQ